MRARWRERGALWGALMATVVATRRRYPSLPTAWLPHGVGNSFAIWLPELLHALEADATAVEAPRSTLDGLRLALRRLVVDNPDWGLYVAPATLGYVLSHPSFNIYKGKLGEQRLFGFGWDAIPHSVTAFSLSLLVHQGGAALDDSLPPDSPLAPLAAALAARPLATSAAVLALLTIIWEGGEYLMREEELRRTGGDAGEVNMEWTLHDTTFDAISNAVGWLAAAWVERGRETPAAPAPAPG